MKSFFVNNHSSELVLFFLGWGMDERPVKFLQSFRDVLYLFDYENLDLDFEFDKYSKIFLIGYSAGVFIPTCINLPKIDYSIAVNGTLALFDENYGLTSDIVKVFENINLENYMNFRKNYLVTNDEELKKFNKNAPLRTIESSMNELNSLKNYYQNPTSYKYDKIFIAKSDKIFSPEKQHVFWGEKTFEIQGGHFPFYYFNSLEELLK